MRTPGDAVLQRYAVQKLHGDEGFAVLVVNFVNRADVRMVQRGGRLGLTLEASQRLRVSGDFIGKKLQGDKSVQGYVLGFVDNAHAAAAELIDDAVMRNCSADERLGIPAWRRSS